MSLLGKMSAVVPSLRTADSSSILAFDLAGRADWHHDHGDISKFYTADASASVNKSRKRIVAQAGGVQEAAKSVPSFIKLAPTKPQGATLEAAGSTGRRFNLEPSHHITEGQHNLLDETLRQLSAHPSVQQRFQSLAGQLGDRNLLVTTMTVLPDHEVPRAVFDRVQGDPSSALVLALDTALIDSENRAMLKEQVFEGLIDAEATLQLGDMTLEQVPRSTLTTFELWANKAKDVFLMEMGEQPRYERAYVHRARRRALSAGYWPEVKATLLEHASVALRPVFAHEFSVNDRLYTAREAVDMLMALHALEDSGQGNSNVSKHLRELDEGLLTAVSEGLVMREAVFEALEASGAAGQFSFEKMKVNLLFRLIADEPLPKRQPGSRLDGEAF